MTNILMDLLKYFMGQDNGVIYVYFYCLLIICHTVEKYKNGVHLNAKLGCQVINWHCLAVYSKVPSP